PRPHSQIAIGRRDPQLLEKGVRHPRIVMLAGMDDHVLDVALHERPVHGRGLHEVWAGADYGEDAPGFTPLSRSSRDCAAYPRCTRARRRCDTPAAGAG